jgi:Tol biopolymer transport system component
MHGWHVLGRGIAIRYCCRMIVRCTCSICHKDGDGPEGTDEWRVVYHTLMRIGGLAVLTFGACTSALAAGTNGIGGTVSAVPVEVDVGLEGRLVFSAEGDIWAMAVDGTDRARLTTDPAEDFDPSWSPDGSRIAFRSHRDGNEEVYVVAADGSQERNLSRSPTSDYSPAWSPDGSTIAFASDRDGDPNEIYVMDADGSNQVRVTDNPGIDEYPTWSPDGTRIAFHCTMGDVNPNGVGDFEICVVNRDGTGLHRLTDSPGENTQPDWSPDGAWIVFESNRLGWPSLPSTTSAGFGPATFGDEDVWVMRTDGSEQHNLTQNPLEDDSFPAWSPDGSWIVFSRFGELRVVSPNDNESQSIPNSPGTDVFPDWIAWVPPP